MNIITKNHELKAGEIKLLSFTFTIIHQILPLVNRFAENFFISTGIAGLNRKLYDNSPPAGESYREKFRLFQESRISGCARPPP